MLPYEFHPLAARELDEAVADYEAAAPGKGLELAQQVRAVIGQIREFPESAPISRGSVRSVPVQPTSRWQFTLHYSIQPPGIRILALAHQKRQPFYWLRRR
jgi:plasmid stabilization system protein ParE